MFTFLFLYQVAYLSGVTCAIMAMMSDKVTSIIGCVLLPFYVLVALAHLWRIAKMVRESLGREVLLRFFVPRRGFCLHGT